MKTDKEIRNYKIDLMKQGILTISKIERQMLRVVWSFDKSIRLTTSTEIRNLLDRNMYDYLDIGADELDVDSSYEKNEFTIEVLK